jgi:hypothetical protein
MPVLAAGSRVRVGFSVHTEYFSTDYDVIKGDLEGCLYGTGQFEWVEIVVEKASVFERDYLLVIGVTAAEFGDTEDFGGLVAQLIETCTAGITISARDPVKVDAIPEPVVGQSGVQQVNNQEGKDPNRRPGSCEGLAFFDYLGCQTGLSPGGTKTGLIVLGLGGLIALGLFLRR